MFLWYDSTVVKKRDDFGNRGIITGVIETLIGTTALAGVFGTGLGGLVGAMLQKESDEIL